MFGIKRHKKIQQSSLIFEGGKYGDIYPLIRDAENICRQAANKPHLTCGFCPESWQNKVR